MQNLRRMIDDRASRPPSLQKMISGVAIAFLPRMVELWDQGKTSPEMRQSTISKKCVRSDTEGNKGCIYRRCTLIAIVISISMAVALVVFFKNPLVASFSFGGKKAQKWPKLYSWPSIILLCKIKKLLWTIENGSIVVWRWDCFLSPNLVPNVDFSHLQRWPRKHLYSIWWAWIWENHSHVQKMSQENDFSTNRSHTGNLKL